MPPCDQYAPLTPADRQSLRAVAKRKWVSFFRGILYFIGLAIAGVALLHLAALFFIHNRRTPYPKQINISDIFNTKTFIVDAVILTPFSFWVVMASCIWLLSGVTPVYIDLLKGKKKLIRFSPSPYTVPGSGYYYVHIGLPGLLYLQVTYEQYMNLDYSRDCYLEISPGSKITLGIQTIEP